MAKLYAKNDDGEYEEVEAFLQSELDEIIKPRAERIARQQYGDYDELKEKAGKVDTIKSEYEDKLKAETTAKSELEKKLAAANLETEKVKIVSKFKLPEELHEFVTGETADEMLQRAEKLSKGVKPGKVTIDKEKKPENAGKTDSKTMAGALFGTKSSDE